MLICSLMFWDYFSHNLESLLSAKLQLTISGTMTTFSVCHFILSLYCFIKLHAGFFVFWYFFFFSFHYFKFLFPCPSPLPNHFPPSHSLIHNFIQNATVLLFQNIIQYFFLLSACPVSYSSRYILFLLITLDNLSLVDVIC